MMDSAAKSPTAPSQPVYSRFSYRWLRTHAHTHAHTCAYTHKSSDFGNTCHALVARPVGVRRVLFERRHTHTVLLDFLAGQGHNPLSAIPFLLPHSDLFMVSDSDCML